MYAAVSLYLKQLKCFKKKKIIVQMGNRSLIVNTKIARKTEYDSLVLLLLLKCFGQENTLVPDVMK